MTFLTNGQLELLDMYARSGYTGLASNYQGNHVVQWAGTERLGTQFGNPRNQISNVKSVKTAENVKEFERYPDNTTPAGRAIVTGVGALKVKAEIIWWSGFNGSPRTSLLLAVADCRLAPSYTLLSIKANDQYVYRSASPKLDTLADRCREWTYYDGTQTTPVDFYQSAVGASNASAYTGYAILAIEGLDVTSDEAWLRKVPIIECEIASDAITPAVNSGQSAMTFGTVDWDTDFHYTMGWDFVGRRVYEITQNYEAANRWQLFAHDIDQRKELWRTFLDLPDGVQNANGEVSYFCVCEGTPYGVIWFQATSPTRNSAALVDLRTGKVLDQTPAVPSSANTFTPHIIQRMPTTGDTKFVVLGRGGIGSVAEFSTTNDIKAFIVNTTQGTMTPVITPDGAGGGGTAGTSSQEYCKGPTENGKVTFFIAEITTNGGEHGCWRIDILESGSVSWTYLFEAGIGNGLAIFYDPQTESILYGFGQGPIIYRWKDGTTTLVRDNGGSGYVGFNLEQSSSRTFGFYGVGGNPLPGYAVGAYTSGYPFTLNLATGVVADMPNSVAYSNAGANLFYETKAYDQVTDTFYENYYNENETGTFSYYTLGDATPNSVDLTEIFTALATLDGLWSASDLVFTGFAGGELNGLSVPNDTTIEDLEQGLLEMFDVSITQSGGKRIYRKMPVDGAFAVDATVSEGDIVERA